MRLKPAAIASLLKATNATAIIHDVSPTATTTVKDIADIASIQATPMVTRPEFDVPTTEAPLSRFFTAEEQKPTSALVFHTSGSTGMPKPIHLKHKDLARSVCSTGPPMDTIVTRPLYHGWGHSCFLHALYCGKMTYLIDTSKPARTEFLVEAFEAAQADFVPAVPNVLELLAQDPRGKQSLKNAQAVTTGKSSPALPRIPPTMVGGARIPDELGNSLISHGINFSATFGSSEAIGCFGTSMFRPPNDTTWDYIRLLPICRPHILMEPIGSDLHEVVLLGTLPGLATSNTDEPVPGSYRTGDIMQRHPTIDAWKFISRTGDFLALATGEKVLGFPIEDRVRESALVKDAVVVGLGKPSPGLLVLPGEELSKEEFLERIWPVVQTANEGVDGFAEIARERVCVLDWGVDFPRTDKGNVIRPQVYRVFEKEIDALYT